MGFDSILFPTGLSLLGVCVRMCVFSCLSKIFLWVAVKEREVSPWNLCYTILLTVPLSTFTFMSQKKKLLPPISNLL